MPVFEITSPEGKTYQVTGPEGSTADQALAQLQQQLGASTPPTSGQPAAAPEGKSLAGFAKNVGSSAVQFGKNVVEPFLHPIETADALAGLGSGLIQKGAQAVGLKSETDDIEAANAVGGMLKDRYGSPGKIANTLYEDPVGVAADASAVLTGGGGLAARLPGMAGKVGEVTRAAGRVVDPLNVPIGAAKLAGGIGSEVVGGLLTHTGGNSIRGAYKAGQEGGEAARAFQDNLRDRVPMEDTINAARAAVGKLREERGTAYREGMAKVGADKTILDFDKIDAALADATQVKTYKGQVLDDGTQAIRAKIGQAVAEWKALDPAEFHTAEGIDALKQKIGNIREATDYGTPDRVVADKAYNAIRGTIVDQVSDYAKVMKGYEEATKTLREIDKTLSLNPNASVDTALRKLQSVLRDNVNTSFGRRRELAEFLIRAGAPQLMERLTGQALKPWTPRGLAKLLGGEILAFKGAAMLPMMSPRLVGEGAYYAGKTIGNLPGREVGQAAFQAGRVAEKLDPREMVKNDAKEAMNDKSFSPSQRESLRAVADGTASIDTVMAVKNLLERKFKFEDGGGASGYQGVQ